MKQMSGICDCCNKEADYCSSRQKFCCQLNEYSIINFLAGFLVAQKNKGNRTAFTETSQCYECGFNNGNPRKRR